MSARFPLFGHFLLHHSVLTFEMAAQTPLKKNRRNLSNRTLLEIARMSITRHFVVGGFFIPIGTIMASLKRYKPPKLPPSPARTVPLKIATSTCAFTIERFALRAIANTVIAVPSTSTSSNCNFDFPSWVVSGFCTLSIMPWKFPRHGGALSAER